MRILGEAEIDRKTMDLFIGNIETAFYKKCDIDFRNISISDLTTMIVNNQIIVFLNDKNSNILIVRNSPMYMYDTSKEIVFMIKRDEVFLRACINKIFELPQYYMTNKISVEITKLQNAAKQYFIKERFVKEIDVRTINDCSNYSIYSFRLREKQICER